MKNFFMTGQNVLIAVSVVTVLLFSPNSFAQNLQSEKFYLIEEAPKSEKSQIDVISIWDEVFVQTSEVYQRFILVLTNWKPKKSPIPEETEAYKRSYHFGRWINDPNDDSCYNTRGRALERDSEVPVKTSDTNQCRVDQGLWTDPYTHKKTKVAKEIQIDHLVALKNAYVSGAFKWSRKYRCLYANYMGNSYHLLSVDARENMAKGDRSPADYLPPREEYRCEYIKAWLKVKLIWGLNMSDYEAEGIEAAIKENKCPASMFRISKKELLEQRRIIQESQYVCRD